MVMADQLFMIDQLPWGIRDIHARLILGIQDVHGRSCPVTSGMFMVYHVLKIRDGHGILCIGNQGCPW